MTNTQLKWQDFPEINCPPKQIFNHENETIFHVWKAIELIRERPDDFQFGAVQLQNLRAQIEGRGNLDLEYASSLEQEDATRPLLIATENDGQHRLIDGYHRALRCHWQGCIGASAWILNQQQTASISEPYREGFERI